MTQELYRKFRPRKLDQIIGQSEAVAQLQSLLNKKRFPHAVLLSGPSGTGKSTIARIIRRELGCHAHDHQLIDCPRLDGVLEKVREIQQNMQLCAMAGKDKPRIYHFEEVQSLSRAGFAQQAMLDMLENTPKHVYFILTTTEPDKLHKAILTRCTKINLKPLSERDLIRVQTEVLALGNNGHVTKEVLQAIAESADGSARDALVMLNQIIDLPDAKAQIDAIKKADTKGKAYDLVKMLVFEKNAPWSKVAKLIESIKDEPEKIRRSVLGFARKMLLTDKAAGRAQQVLISFEQHWYDSGNAGLVRACYECFANKD